MGGAEVTKEGGLPLLLAAVILMVAVALAAFTGEERAHAQGRLLSVDADLSVGTIDSCVSTPSTTLSSMITNATDPIPVVDTTGFPASGTISVDDEIISYTGTTATSFTGATRGALGTTAASHASGAFVGRTFQIDFVFKQAPQMFGPEFDLVYDGSILRIDSVDSATTASLFLTKNGSASVSDFSDATPDSDGTYHAGVFDLDLTGPSGNGTVIRLNVSVTGSGTSALTISSPLLLDVNGTDTTGSFSFQNGEVRVGSSCPAPPAAIGGVSEFLADRGDTASSPSNIADGSGLSTDGYAAIAGGATAALVLAAITWYAWARRPR